MKYSYRVICYAVKILYGFERKENCIINTTWIEMKEVTLSKIKRHSKTNDTFSQRNLQNLFSFKQNSGSYYCCLEKKERLSEGD